MAPVLFRLRLTYELETLPRVFQYRRPIGRAYDALVCRWHRRLEVRKVERDIDCELLRADYVGINEYGICVLQARN